MKLPHGRYKDVELNRVPSWYLRYVVKSWKGEICESAREVLTLRSHLGIIKPKSKAKKTEESLQVPEKVIRKPHNLDMFIPENANSPEKDLF